ncbi:hypothetical protein BWQ96_04791 [Gracilariopsis chorda]|uniref:Uncharacterized protein n=1 Tax=Gracilariopsis chorda TaxID=448386 RepID=A0A2V3ITP5_9FLOR|nr:hypothetical protein BWQ96_04791 [Gracilariopsis chorda]|eukprot:PXF45493.1 hypothetical protein BWQ96_04791 [Gracilariopsis chorda]
MVSALRRRANATSSDPAEATSDSRSQRVRAADLSTPKCILPLLPPLTLVLLFLLRSRSDSSVGNVLTSSSPCDDESTISSAVLPTESYTPPKFSARGVACMPTVTRMREGRQVEYVSNAVKSWRLATNASLDLRQLTVFDMDKHPTAEPSWLQKVFQPGFKELPTWLRLEVRDGKITPPRKFTLGDDEQRVHWRSKEALDYAEVLQRCAEGTDVDYIIIVQDDVLFRSEMQHVLHWCDEHLEDAFVTNANGRLKAVRKCSASLFDLTNEKEDGHELRSSNMVARVWKRETVESMVRYFRANFDEAPVDWLADRRCKNQRRRTVVMEPNPVRHRGSVSSFAANAREGTIT